MTYYVSSGTLNPTHSRAVITEPYDASSYTSLNTVDKSQHLSTSTQFFISSRNVIMRFGSLVKSHTCTQHLHTNVHAIYQYWTTIVIILYGKHYTKWRNSLYRKRRVLYKLPTTWFLRNHFYRYCCRKSAIPSVHLSVCLSDACIVTKLNDTLQIFWYHTKGQSL